MKYKILLNLKNVGNPITVLVLLYDVSNDHLKHNTERNCMQMSDLMSECSEASDCFLYSPERQALFSLIEHYIPNFPKFSKQRKLDIILRGIYIENEDFSCYKYFSYNCSPKIYFTN